MVSRHRQIYLRIISKLCGAIRNGMCIVQGRTPFVLLSRHEQDIDV